MVHGSGVLWLRIENNLTTDEDEELTKPSYNIIIQEVIEDY